MVGRNTYFLLFHTIHDVLRVEKILKKQGKTYELVPVPRNLSSDCGMCIQLGGDVNDVKESMKGIEIHKCFFFDGNTYVDITPS
ncbi:MAG TPA: DUF3343 domain-containing protein [Syntrophorhabdaceae bacterium]|nr:DUF3343 domain-containing protein [Syntrophorhabdaceae bacterium]